MLYVYTDDPTYAGGAVAYSATTTPSTTAANSGRFFVDSVTVPARGASGGGGGPCVALDMFLRAGLMARDAGRGDVLHTLTDGGVFGETAVIDHGGVYMPECIRIELAGGAAVIVSESTPCNVSKGGSFRARDLQVGDELAARYGDIDRWEPIVAVMPCGKKPVARLHLGGLSYAAGEHADKMIYTHNPSKP